MANKKQMQVIVILWCMALGHAMEATQLVEQVSRLAEAATSAARAAADASARLGAASSTVASPTLETATKILKNPDTFSGEDPTAFVTWKMQFESWLGYGDAKCAEMLAQVEQSKVPPDGTKYSAEEKVYSQRFYAVLSSYLRGRCLQMVRSNYAKKDGFRLWYEMIKEFIPSTKQRALALAQALSQFPAFKEKSSMLEGVLQYENLVQQYETASGQNYPGDLKAATLIRCAPSRLREHLQLSLSDVSTYADVREALLSYERVSKSFSQEQSYKQLQVEDSKTSDGPTPMEVDRVMKGKGKGKKGKSKGSSWWNSSWSFGGRGRGAGGRGRKGGKGKGRGKGKGKKGSSYSKGKQKGKKGGSKNSDACHICGAFDHWSRECPNRMMVNYIGQPLGQQGEVLQVAQQVAPAQVNATPMPTSMSTASSTGSQATISYPHSQYRSSNSTGSTVRRVYNIGGPQPSSSSSSCRMIRSHDIPFDGYHQWMNGQLDIDGGGHVFLGEIHKVHQPLSVRPVQWPCEKSAQTIILDSGSDVSLLPKSFQVDSKGSSKHQLQDCQGNALQVAGTKDAEIYVDDADGECLQLNHSFVVGDVTSCLMSLGQLYSNGWSIVHEEGCGDHSLGLRAPDGAMIPVFYKGMSFAIEGHIRCISAQTPKIVEVEEDSNESSESEASPAVVRYVVAAQDEVEAAVQRRWHYSPRGLPFFKHVSKRFLDARAAWGEQFQLRSTLIKPANSLENRWQLVEWCQNMLDLDDASDVIEDCGGEEVLCLTMLSSSEMSVEDDFTMLEDDVSAEVIVRFREQAQDIHDRAQVLEQAQMDDQADPGDDELLEELAALGAEAEHAMMEDDSQAIPSSLIIEGKSYSEGSDIRDLRAAAAFLGLSQAGGKKRIYERMAVAIGLEERRQALLMANEEYKRAEPMVRFDCVPKLPTKAERRLHEVTHLPFRPWCDVCVLNKSKDNHQKSTKPEDDAQRSHPTVQMDCGVIIGDVTMLVLVDVWTRYVEAVPLKKTTRSVSEAVLSFLGTLGHLETVELVSDQEKVLMAGLELVKMTREKMGLNTILTTGKAFQKGRTAIAERAIQTVRAQQKTLSAHVRERAQVALPDDHPIHGWAARHAAWLLCRFQMHSTTKSTPFQLLFGRPYKGKICSFGSTVYCLDPKVTKYQQAWRKGIWVGKDGMDQDLVVYGSNRLLRSRAVRLCAQEYDGGLLALMDVEVMVLKKSATHQNVNIKLRELPAPLPQLPRTARDEEADAVRAHADEHPDSDAEVLDSSPGRADGELGDLLAPLTVEGPSNFDQAMHGGGEHEVRSPSMRRSLSDGGEPSPTRRRIADEAQSALRRSAEGEGSQPSSKHARTENVNTVSDAKHKFYYDDVNVVVDEGEDLLESWEMDDETSALLDFDEESFRERSEGDGPPDVGPAELEKLDAEATIEEIERLRKIGVIESADGLDEPEDLVYLDTTNVFDWRFREGRWKRRCRIVAREYKTNQTTIEEFSPTSNMFVLKLLLVLAQLQNLVIFVADVKDAFLTVPQKNPVWVKVPSWVRSLSAGEDVLLNALMWRLMRCLPGQRNAALMWSNHFKDMMLKEEFECFVGMPTVFSSPQQADLPDHSCWWHLACLLWAGLWMVQVNHYFIDNEDGRSLQCEVWQHDVLPQEEADFAGARNLCSAEPFLRQ